MPWTPKPPSACTPRGALAPHIDQHELARLIHFGLLLAGTRLEQGTLVLPDGGRLDGAFFLVATALGAAVSDALEDGRVVSGVDGQYDFVTMAHALRDGRSVLMLRSSRAGAESPRSNIPWSYGHTTIPRHLRDVSSPSTASPMCAASRTLAKTTLLGRGLPADRVLPDDESALKRMGLASPRGMRGHLVRRLVALALAETR